jgi:hypothetical protein
MPLRKVNIQDVSRINYGFGPPITAQMADIGRTLGSASVGLAIQTVRPGHWSSRRHRHVCTPVYARPTLKTCRARLPRHESEVELAGRRPRYFAGSSLMLWPPFATGMTQIGVATSAEPRSDV